MKTRSAALAVLTLLLLATTGVRAADFGVHVVFSDGEIETIRAYYHSSTGGLSSHGGMGNAGMGMGNGRSAGGLPPGIARNLERGKPLPPGIAKQFLPQALTVSLPPVPDGYERLVLAGRVLLVEVATRVIVDVITDVIMD